MRPVSLALTVLRNRLGAVPRPSWCTYIVTYRCNARCRMCDSWRMKPGGELTPAQVGEVFARLGRLDVVRLTGGEPFLRADLPEIAERVLSVSRPAVLHITTNGSFPERVGQFVARCPAPGKLRFLVSFDGLPQEHNENRGKDVTFELALETVRRLAALRETHGVAVSANHTVISPRSLEDNEGLRSRLAELRVEVHAVLAYAESAMYAAGPPGKKAERLLVPARYPLHPLLTGADVLGFVQRELARTRHYRDLRLRWGKRYYLRGLRARLAANGDGRHQPKPRPKCVALRSHVRILPDGSVPVCQFNSEQVGNLLAQSFDQIWHGARSASARAWVAACPGCWAECELLPNAIYSGDILRLWF